MSADIQLTRREYCLLLAALLAAEDSPSAFRAGLAALRQKPATDREVTELGERMLDQLDPDKTL
jgi:anthranilate phosphoribosyltransferase